MLRYIYLSYILAGVLFILALKLLSSVKTARTGSLLGICGMILSIVVTMFLPGLNHKIPILITLLLGGAVGALTVRNISMTEVPQLIAGFHSLVGLAAAGVSYGAMLAPERLLSQLSGQLSFGVLIEILLGGVIGALTFSSSVIAYTKLKGSFPASLSKLATSRNYMWIILFLIISLGAVFIKTELMLVFNFTILLSLILGILLITTISSSDMPVVVSVLNSYSGWATVGVGFTLSNNLLIITGALVGTSGAMLSYIMCKGMNRSLIEVLFSKSATSSTASGGEEEQTIQISNVDEAAEFLTNSFSVIIVPGYGMAVSQAQHAVRELVDELARRNIKTRFALHPVAGRMPGHMNVLLAEANINYDQVLELDEINSDFINTDVVLVIGANDITNPAAKTNPESPIYGMPILNVDQARVVLFIKRSMAKGYSGVDNDLFYRPNTFMLFGDAKLVVDSIIKSINEN